MKSIESGSLATQDPPTDARLETLFERVAGGEEAAIEALYDEFGALMFATARALLADASVAEDCVVGAFADILRRAGHFDSRRCSASQWLLLTVRRQATEIRSKGALAGDSPVASTARSSLTRALLELPEHQRRIVELAVHDGLGTPAIAERIGAPLRLVEARLDRGLAGLRQRLCSQGAVR